MSDRAIDQIIAELDHREALAAGLLRRVDTHSAVVVTGDIERLRANEQRALNYLNSRRRFNRVERRRMVY